jgi:transcriptional regulator BetI-like protein
MRGPNAKRAALLATGARHYVPVRKALTAAIRDGQRAGVFARDADAVTLANLAIATIEGVRLQHQLDPRAARKNRVGEAVAELLVQRLVRARTVADGQRRSRTAARGTSSRSHGTTRALP